MITGGPGGRDLQLTRMWLQWKQWPSHCRVQTQHCAAAQLLQSGAPVMKVYKWISTWCTFLLCISSALTPTHTTYFCLISLIYREVRCQETQTQVTGPHQTPTTTMTLSCMHTKECRMSNCHVVNSVSWQLSSSTNSVKNLYATDSSLICATLTSRPEWCHAYDSLQRENGGHSKHPTELARINGVYSNWWRVSSVAHTAADSGCKHAVSMWSSLHTKTFQPFRGRKGATSRSRLIIIASVTTFAGLILICWSSSTFPQGGSPISSVHVCHVSRMNQREPWDKRLIGTAP